MQFDHISMEVSGGELSQARLSFKKLLVELAVRDANFFVGSGLGGNNFQLLVLMNLKHTLSSTSKKISLSGEDEIIWGVSWIASSSISEIRKELNSIFPTIVERKKFLALALQTVLESSDSLQQNLKKYDSHFPNLKSILDEDARDYGAHMSSFDKMILAFLLCQQLSFELDNNQMHSIDSVGKFLLKLPAEIILLAVRRFIDITRVIKFNLDEHPTFSKAIDKVNRLVT